jgi:hypothetical protein
MTGIKLYEVSAITMDPVKYRVISEGPTAGPRCDTVAVRCLTNVLRILGGGGSWVQISPRRPAVLIGFSWFYLDLTGKWQYSVLIMPWPFPSKPLQFISHFITRSYWHNLPQTHLPATHRLQISLPVNSWCARREVSFSLPL